MTVEACEPLRRLTSVSTVWTWNTLYQGIYERVKFLLKVDTLMKLYDTRKSLYLETDTSGVDLGTTLLEVRDNLNCRYNEALDNAVLQCTAFTKKIISTTEWWYSNI